MDDVWFGPGLSRSDFDGFLRALSLQGQGNPLLLAFALAPDGARLVAASHALFDLFEVVSDDALSERLLAGHDPGARRLVNLLQTLPLNGAPRLERLRFLVGPGSEVVTVLCRRVAMGDGPPMFVAAALGIRAGLIAPTSHGRMAQPSFQAIGLPSGGSAANGSKPQMSVQAIQATLRARWPASRRVRFLWQTDENAICTVLTPPLEDVVGRANADLVNRNLLDLAPLIDPSGRLAEALNARATWSGLDVAWPIADAPAGIAVGLGAIPAFDRERGFEGFRGYGVIHLDKIIARDLAVFPANPAPPALSDGGNVVAFRGGKALSAEDQLAFDILGVELRDKAGLTNIEPTPKVPEADARAQPEVPVSMDASLPATSEEEPATGPTPETPSAAETIDATRLAPANVEPTPADAIPTSIPDPTAAPIEPAHPAAPQPHRAVPALCASRAEEIGRNGLAVLDRLAVGLLVSRDNVPIFANRHLLDLLGFADEDALHAAGGMTHLFGDQPGNVTGSEAVGIRDRHGAIIAAHARMQRIDWDGLPATLLTLRPSSQDIAPTASAYASTNDTDERDELTTEPQRDHIARDQSELRDLRAILETSTDGVAVIDARCDVLSLNRSAEALLGCDRGTVVGKPFLDLFPPHNQGLAADYFDGIKSSGTKSLLNDGRELLIKAHRGGTIPVLMTLGRLGAADAPEGARFSALFRDLTHWKMVQGELEKAGRDAEHASALKSDFLAKVSHEIRTPLNAIIGFAEVILEERFGPVGNERYKDYLRDIHGSGTHVMSLVNDLLDLSKIEAGKMELAVDAVDANKVISECVGTMQPQASRERIIMRLSLAPTLPRIRADERSLRQIMLNLLSNAVKYNEPGGQVIIATATTEEGKVLIRIRDTGPGMSESDIAAALEPFRQLSTKRQAVEGTGLGLPLTKALVEANEASFTIRSRVDQGTLVEVAFPPARVLAQ